MADTEIPNGIIFYHYPFSPYARRVIWYLTLRNIPYAQCLQPPVLPRPDLSTLGIKYRRIPLLAINRDVYADTRIIISALESHFPPSEAHPPLSSTSIAGLTSLLSSFTIDAGVFARAAQLLPSSLPVMKDPAFTKDREDFTGRSWSAKDIDRARPEALAHMRKIFDVLETLLGDGRDWIAATQNVALADIEAVWPFDWLVELKALPEGLFGAEVYPKTYAWIHRFRAAIKAAKGKSPKPVNVKGKQAAEFVLKAKLARASGVDAHDPMGLKEGDAVKVWPIDSGFNHKDEGKLVTLNKDEVVLAVKAKDQAKEVHLHAPRWGFRIVAAGGSSKL